MDASTRNRVESALGPAWKERLLDACRTLGVRRERWPDVATLRRFFVTMAVSRLVEEYRHDRGWCESKARREAAWKLGVDPETVGRRLRRWSN